MKNSTLVSTRAILLVLENIESNVKLNDRPPSKDKANVADSKRKAESNVSCNPKKAKKGRTEKHCSLCKKHGGVHTMHTRSAGTIIKTEATRRQEGCPNPTSRKLKGWDELCPANLYQHQKGSIFSA